MQILESIEAYGYFWLAAEPDNKLSGILRISEKGDASLEIFGALDSPDSESNRRRVGQRLRILGVTDKVGVVTLVDCFVLQQNTVRNIGGQLSRSSLQVGSVFCGAHFEAEEICFSGVTFSVEGLDEWFWFHHRPFDSTGVPTGTMSITYTQPEPITFAIPDDFIIGFHMGAGMNSGMFQETITTKMSITMESSGPRTFDEFMQVLRKVKNFLCLAFDRTVSFTSITGFQQEPNAQYTHHNTVDIYGRFDPYDLPKEEISPGWFLIPFEDIAHKIQDYLPRWLEHYQEYEPTFNLYFTVATNRYMHLEGGFLFLVHGMESLHRRSSSDTMMSEEEFNTLIGTILQSTPDKWKQLIQTNLNYANEFSLQRRIRQMVSPFRDLFGNDSARSKFTNQVVKTRNYLTHYDRGSRNEAVTEPEELLQLHSKLEALVQLHMLRLLGMEDDHIRAIATRYPPLKKKLGID